MFAWSAPSFAAWCALSPWYSRPPAWIAEAGLGLFRGNLARGLEFHGRVFDVVTGLAMVAPSGETGVAVVEINPMVSTYGAALFVSLALASGARTRTLVLGLAMLLPFQAWSIAFDFLAQLVRIDPALALQAGLVGWKSEFVAFGYQLGSLICPVLAPVAIWAGLEKRFVDQLTTNLRSVHAGFLAE